MIDEARKYFNNNDTVNTHKHSQSLHFIVL